jgi:hypothetical protein
MISIGVNGGKAVEVLPLAARNGWASAPMMMDLSAGLRCKALWRCAGRGLKTAGCGIPPAWQYNSRAAGRDWDNFLFFRLLDCLSASRQSRAALAPIPLRQEPARVPA